LLQHKTDGYGGPKDRSWIKIIRQKIPPGGLQESQPVTVGNDGSTKTAWDRLTVAVLCGCTKQQRTRNGAQCDDVTPGI
jgi:hypothetical protein